jgi:hypothetical protein
LLELRTEPTPVGDRAYRALAHLAKEEAVPRTKQRQIVTALISDIADPDVDELPGEALVAIAWDRLGVLQPGEAEPGWYVDESGNYTGRWKAKRWEKWRETVGL